MTIATRQLMLSQKRAYAAPGQQVFTATTTWTVPAGVYSVSVVCVGQGNEGSNDGGGYSGAGGGLGWRNNIAVSPGQQISVFVGYQGSYFGNIDLVCGYSGVYGGGFTGTGGTNGGDFYGGSGGTYGGGGGRNSGVARPGGPGAVRVIWPGDLRQFPSTRTANE